ncbi:MAG: hypothetical protein Q8R82_03700 [Hyphomonadaceae bacterium]|nr:hypothetical protein [Hyphomonadaceae bacterium]
MTVSWRHMLAGAGVATFAATVALTAMGQQCNTCAPPSPPPPPPPAGACCQPPRNITVQIPGVNVATPNVNVGATSTVVASAGVSTTLSSGVIVSGGGSAGASFFGGGGGYYSNPGVPPSTISGLAVEGGYDTRLVEDAIRGTEEYCVDKIVEEFRTRPVQALCIDDRNTPHPASRVDGEMAVSGNYTGELYRCVAGTHMQVTLGDMIDGKANFDTGEAFSCGKGEALYHSRGGVLQCRIQVAERNCNERSLLRKFGPGVKLVSVPVKKTICEPAKRETITKVVKEVKVPRPVVAGDLVLDGGVGQGY